MQSSNRRRAAKSPKNQWVAKREKKRQQKEQQKDDGWKEGYEKKVYDLSSAKFTEYYKVRHFRLNLWQTQFAEIFDGDAEFAIFEATLKEKLPVTFRLNSGENNY